MYYLAHSSDIYAASIMLNWKEHWSLSQKFSTYSVIQLLALPMNFGYDSHAQVWLSKTFSVK